MWDPNAHASAAREAVYVLIFEGYNQGVNNREERTAEDAQMMTSHDGCRCEL